MLDGGLQNRRQAKALRGSASPTSHAASSTGLCRALIGATFGSLAVGGDEAQHIGASDFTTFAEMMISTM
jgi:hypothetical protein